MNWILRINSWVIEISYENLLCSLIKEKLQMFGFFNAFVGEIKIIKDNDELDTLMNGKPRLTPEQIDKVLGDKFPKTLVHERDSTEILPHWEADWDAVGAEGLPWWED